MADYLVVQLARFGDIIQTKRLIKSLEAEGNTVHLGLDASLAPVASIIYPQAVLHPLRAHAGAAGNSDVLGENARVFSALKNFERQTGFAAVYILNRSLMASALAGLFPPEKVKGYRRAKGQNEASAWSRMAGRWTKDRATAPLNLVDFWAWFHPNPVEAALVNPVARPAGSGHGSQSNIGVVLAGRQSRRSLPPEELAACVQAVFSGRDGPKITLLGSKGERPLARRLSRLFSQAMLQKTEDRSGETALTDLPELLRGLDLVLTPDTGTMHLAAHLGVPVMAFFLSSAWCFETGPYGLGHRVWQSAASCSPCLETAPCPNAVKCLAPFRHKAFLGHLAGKHSPEWPEGMLGLVSTLDSAGVSYLAVDGEDHFAEARLAKRALLAEHLLGESLESLSAHEANTLFNISQDLFSETDWILPRYL